MAVPGTLVLLPLRLALALSCLGGLVHCSAELLKVRLFWVRHGQSCANVMDRCAVEPPESNSLLPEVERSLKSYPLDKFKNASLVRAFGVAAATEEEKDCSVELAGVGLEPGARGEGGAVVRVHDLYLDPALTDCSRLQSVQAGRSFIQWLKASGSQRHRRRHASECHRRFWTQSGSRQREGGRLWSPPVWAAKQQGARLHFVGSSFLMRAFETACAMFLEPCSGRSAMNCSGVLHGEMKVTPLPYMTERAPRGLTAAQADNMPREVDEQNRMIEAVYGRELPVDSTYAKLWPRYAQQYEKFKAFVAVQLLPLIGAGADLGQPGGSAFQAAMEAALPETLRHEDHGKEQISFEWEGGAYATGPEFTKAEYAALAAPEVNLAVVGHNQMMMEYCQQGRPPKPNNNAVLEKLFILQSTLPAAGSPVRKTVLRELRGKCMKVMDAPDGKASMGSLVEADVATCATPFKVSEFLRLPKGGPLEATACVKLASEGAYPIQPEFLQGRLEF